MIHNIPDLRQSPQYGKYLETIDWQVKKIAGVSVFIRKIPLVPLSIIKIQRSKKIPDLKKIDHLAKKYRAISVAIEPSAINYQESAVRLEKNGYKLSKSPFLPTKTIWLDLRNSEEKLLAWMKKDTRRILKRSAESKDTSILSLSKTKEIKRFFQAWKKATGWHLIIPSLNHLLNLKKAFAENSLFLVACPRERKKLPNQEIIAGTIILFTKKTAYYYYAFTSKKGRQLFAQYQLVWEAIRQVKKRGCQIFDLEGIADPRFPIKSWQGFSHFKKSFGGKQINYPGCFRKWQFPW